MSLKARLFAAALPAFALLCAAPATAQDAAPCFTSTTTTNDDGTTTTVVSGGINTDVTGPVMTSDANNGAACDVRVQSTGSITTTAGSALILDSDNDLLMSGNISSENADDTTGIEIQGGNTGDVTVEGAINLTEEFERSTNSDNIPEGPFAQGSGRTGILISGASPFIGNVTTSTTSSINIEGNDSYAFRLMETAGLTGDITLASGQAGFSILGSNSTAVSLEGDVTGNVSSQARIIALGENVSGITVDGDISGQLTHAGSIVNTGYTATTRQRASVNALLGDDQLNQAGSAIRVSGNIGEGVLNTGTVSQIGIAPAILFDGESGNISVGVVTSITEPNGTDQYAFVNRGVVQAQGVFNDFNATALEVRNAELLNGIGNSGDLGSSTFRSADDGSADNPDNTGLARVIVLGTGAIVSEINNAGTISATVTEDSEQVFADINNPLDARSLEAIAIDVEANASITSIINSGLITATLTGRDGTAIAIRDTSGTISVIDNTGTIGSRANVNAQLFDGTPNFTTIALDLSANTTGVTINQTTPVDPDPDDDVTPPPPFIVGDVLLGTGDDTVNLAAGNVIGDLAFADGADTLSLSGGSIYSGTLTDSDGQLAISVIEGSSLIQSTAASIDATSASFDETSTFSPTIDGQTATVSTLTTTGNITFADGATIAPRLSSVVDPSANTFTLLDAGGTLALDGTLESLLSFDSPFLYDTTFNLDPNNPNALLISFDLRSADSMGLDPVQAASFGSTFEALGSNNELASAVVQITDGNEFRSALNQLLPEFAAAARQFVVANVDGAVGAVGTHLDNARLSTDQPGGAWIQEFTYFADRDLAGLSEQYRGFGFGFTGGLDTAFGPFHTAGINFGFASTEIEDVVGFDDPLDVLTLQAGLYGGIKSGRASIDVYGGGGFSDFEQERNVQIGNFSDSSQGDWSGTHLNGTIRGGYDINLSKKLWLRPSFSVDYLRLKEKGYVEDGPVGIGLTVDGRTSELAGATAMINLGARFEGKRTWIRPSIRAGYRNEFINDGVTTSYGFTGLTQTSLLESEAFPKEGFLLGFTLAAGSGYSSVGLDFDSDIRDGFMRHTGRIVLRMIF